MAYRKGSRSRSRSSGSSRTRTRARSTGYKSRRPVSGRKRTVRGGNRASGEIRIVVVHDTSGVGVNPSVAQMAGSTKQPAPAKKAKF